MIRVHLVLLSAVCAAVYQERLVLKLATGGRGMVLIMDLMMPLFAFFAVALPFRGELVRMARNTRFWAFFPFLLLAFLLPLLGVAFMHFPARSAYTSYTALLPMAYLAFGYIGAGMDARVATWARRYLLLAVVSQMGLALIQSLGELGSLPSFLGWIREWDLAFKDTYQPDNLIMGRSTGFYLNPNSLGIWALLAFWTCFHALEGRARTVGTVAAALTVLLCQSRGSLAALLASGFIYAVIWMKDHATRRERLKATLLAVMLAAPLAVAFLPGVGDAFLGRAQDLPYVGPAVARYTSGARILSQGAKADENFQERTEYWRIAFDYLANHPFGSLGSPEMVIKRPSDNQYVAILEQGSFYYEAALLAVFLAAITQLRSRSRASRALATAALAYAINGISAVPFQYSASHPFWILVGVYLAEREAREPAEEDLP